jgi:hypothetical protein
MTVSVVVRQYDVTIKQCLIPSFLQMVGQRDRELPVKDPPVRFDCLLKPGQLRLVYELSQRMLLVWIPPVPLSLLHHHPGISLPHPLPSSFHLLPSTSHPSPASLFPPSTDNPVCGDSILAFFKQRTLRRILHWSNLSLFLTCKSFRLASHVTFRLI